MVQQIALRPDADGGRASLGTNPDVTTDLLVLLDERRRDGHPFAYIGQVNDHMPFMFGRAEVPASRFDFIVDDPREYHELFCPPNLPISTVDHAIALTASMLIRDGGTIQIGIGELGDAIVYAMILRHRENALWRRVLADTRLGPRFAAEQAALGGDAPFEHGLYAVTEMFVDGFLDLYREGILKRRVEPDGALLHGAFMLGPRAFYQELRAMPDAERALFRMMPVSFTNDLLGPEWEMKIAQRRDARFINSAMMATLGGALVSDGLADGRVVSGVGGQYNFVAQAHSLPGGRSLIALRATRDNHGRIESNIRFGYGHVTIPRHLRDIVLTEYGVADLRGRTDAEVAAAMLDIADSRFQPGLLAEAQRAGKLPADYRIRDEHRRQPAGGARRRARAAPRRGLLRRTAVRNGPHGRGTAARPGAEAPEGARGILGRAARDRGAAPAPAAARPGPRAAVRAHGARGAARAARAADAARRRRSADDMKGMLAIFPKDRRKMASIPFVSSCVT